MAKIIIHSPKNNLESGRLLMHLDQDMQNLNQLCDRYEYPVSEGSHKLRLYLFKKYDFLFINRSNKEIGIFDSEAEYKSKLIKFNIKEDETIEFIYGFRPLWTFVNNLVFYIALVLSLITLLFNYYYIIPLFFVFLTTVTSLINYFIYTRFSNTFVYLKRSVRKKDKTV